MWWVQVLAIEFDAPSQFGCLSFGVPPHTTGSQWQGQGDVGVDCNPASRASIPLILIITINTLGSYLPCLAWFAAVRAGPSLSRVHPFPKAQARRKRRDDFDDSDPT
jgi:hypothetical protein